MTSITESESVPRSSHVSAHCKPLLDVATKDLFRTNAFRITGMPVDSTSRDLAKHAEKLKVLAELGQDFQPNAVFPLRLPPTLEDIRDAMQRLKDPEKRLIEEFFWFWPQNFGESGSDAAIQALQRGDLQIAADIWMSKRKHPTEGIVATHNLALIFHVKALSWENYSFGHEVDSKRRAEITEYWKATFYRWNQILTNEQFWGKIVARVRQLDEPSLTTGFVRRMRGTAAMALIKINAELALAFAEAGKFEIARLHTDLMDRVHEGASHVANIVEVVLTPARKRLQEHVRHARQAGDANPGSAVAAARDLLDNTRGTLSVFDLFITKNIQFRNDAFDEVAETCNRLQVTYNKATNDNETCLEFLKVILPFAASRELHEQIEKNIQTLAKNIEAIRRDKKIYGNLRPISSAPALSTFNGIGFTLYGSSDVDSTNGSYLSTYYFCFFYIPIFPICRYRVIGDGNSYRFLGKAPLRSGDKLHLAIALGLIGFFIISAAISGGSQSSTSTSSSNYSRSPYTTGASPYRQPDLSGTGSADSANAYVKREQLALARENEEIESERPTVRALDDQVDNLAREIKRDRIYVDQTSQYQIDAFNAKLARYRVLVQEAQTGEATFNRKVDNYNARLRAYNSGSPFQSPADANYPSTNPNTGLSESSAIPGTAQSDWAIESTPSASPPSAAPTRRIAVVKISGNDTLNVRAEASAVSAIIGTLRNGENIYLDPTQPAVNYEKGVTVNWQRIITFSGLEGWVNADYLTNPYR